MGGAGLALSSVGMIRAGVGRAWRALSCLGVGEAGSGLDLVWLGEASWLLGWARSVPDETARYECDLRGCGGL